MQPDLTKHSQALQTNPSPVQLALPGIEFAPRQVREHGLVEAHTWPLVSDGKVQGVVQASFRVHASMAWSFPEQETLRSQFAISKGRGGRRYAPLVFTEQGVAMLSGVLNSERAIRVNILIMRAFVRLRELAATHKDLSRKLAELEKKVSVHDERITAVFEAIKELLTPGDPPKRQQIGFRAGKVKKV